MQNYIKLTLEVDEMYFKGLMFSRLLRENYPNTRDMKSSDLFGVADLGGGKVWYINTILANDMSGIFNLAALYGRYKESQLQDVQRQAEEDEDNFALWKDANYQCVFNGVHGLDKLYKERHIEDEKAYTLEDLRYIFNQSY